MPCEVLKIPQCTSPLPSMLGNLPVAVLRCWGCKSPQSLQRIPGCAPGEDLHRAAYIAMLSQGYCCDARGFPKVDRAVPLPMWMPWLVAAISVQHRLPPAMAPAAPGSTPSPALRTGKPGLGYSSGPPIYQLLKCQHKWFTVFPFSRSAIKWMTSRHEVFPLQEQEQGGEALHWQLYCSFSWGKGLECIEKKVTIGLWRVVARK